MVAMTNDPQVGLGERGQALYQALSGTDTPRNALALEAARTADRLDELDEIIHGRGVLNLMQFRVLDSVIEDTGQHVEVEVKFQNVLSEARQQQTTFATLLRVLGAEGSAAAAPSEQPQTGDDVLAAARARREGRTG